MYKPSESGFGSALGSVRLVVEMAAQWFVGLELVTSAKQRKC